MKFRRRNTTTNATINNANANAEGTSQQDPKGQVDTNLVDNTSTPTTTTMSRINNSSMSTSSSSTSTRTRTSTTPISAAKKVKEEEFSARRSARIVSDIHSDNDVWCEYLAVVEMLIPGGKKKVFVSLTRTHISTHHVLYNWESMILLVHEFPNNGCSAFYSYNVPCSSVFD